MTAAFVVYFLILFVCTAFSSAYKSSDKSVKTIIGYLIPIVVVAIVLGGRYKTGSDWENYKEYYDVLCNIPLADAFNSSLEPIYVLLNKFISFFGCGSSVFFAVVAIIQFSIIYLLFKEDKTIIPYALFIYIISNLSLDVNIVRQSLAMSLVFLASKYVNRNKIKCALLIAIAVGFHYSALITIPIIFIDNRLFRFLDNTYFVVIIYFVSIALASLISDFLSGYIQMFEYGYKYGQNANNLDQEMELSTGYGIIAKHILNLTMIFLWTKVRKYISNPFYLNVYRITVLGFFLFNIFGISVFLSRMALYYYHFLFMIWAIICYSAFHNKAVKKYNVYVLGAVLLYLMIFAVGIYHGDGGASPYTFKWIM